MVFLSILEIDKFKMSLNFKWINFNWNRHFKFVYFENENSTGVKFLSEKLDGRRKKYLVDGRTRNIARPFIREGVYFVFHDYFSAQINDWFFRINLATFLIHHRQLNSESSRQKKYKQKFGPSSRKQTNKKIENKQATDVQSSIIYKKSCSKSV